MGNPELKAAVSAALLVALTLGTLASGEEGLPGGLEKANKLDRAAANPWQPTELEKGLYDLSDNVLSLASQEPTLLEQQVKEYEALEELEKSKFGLADAKLEEASEKYAAAAQKAIKLEAKERKLRVQVINSKLMKKVLETKLKAAEGSLGNDLGLQKGQ